MKCNRIRNLMICALLASLMILGAGTAIAEEKYFTERVELFSEGAFPTDLPVPISTFGLNSFDQYIIKQLNAKKSTIDVEDYGFTREEFKTAYWSLLNSHPELFFVSGAYSFYTNSASVVSEMIPQYKYSGSELTRLQSVYQSGVAAVVEYASSANTDVGRMLRANDYLCAHFEYDTNYQIYSPELLFDQGKGVCQAYMLAYRAVLNELGITNITVSSDEMNHTWNMVYLDDSWYHIDVTWNDPIDDVPLRACHDNFLLSDAGITATEHYGWDDSWEIVFEATNTKYDRFFWINLNQVASMDGDVVYYADSDYSTTKRSLYAYDLTSGTNREVLKYDYGYGSYYRNYNPVWVSGDSLYYGVRHLLYCVPLEGGTPEQVYTTGDSSQWIWYPIQSGSTLNMYVASTPFVSGSIHSCNVNINYTLKLDKVLARMDIGGTLQLNATLTPTFGNTVPLEWSSSDESIASVNASGRVQAAGAGVATITARYNAKTTASCTVVVNANHPLCVPENVTDIQSEAFSSTTLVMVKLPDSIKTIGSKAFADNEYLLLVEFPDAANTSIAADAFTGSPNVTLLCTAGSAGEAFAIAQNIPYVVLP